MYGVLGSLLLLIVFPRLIPRITGGTRGRYVRQQKTYAKLFKAGNTNVPLLEMDWFGPTVHFCRVNQSGRGSARRDVGHAKQDGVSISLDETNLHLLIETINQLSPPPTHSLPIERQIVLGCIRSNQWFHAVYDRADIPAKIEKLAEITHAYLPWYVPAVPGRMVARATGGAFMCASIEAPIGVSGGENYLQVWNLGGLISRSYPPLKLFSGIPVLAEYEHPMAISPDGSTVAIVTYYGLYAVDWKNQKLLWQSGPLEHEGGYHGMHLVIADNGRALFAAGAHTIKRWELASGKMEAVLVSNPPNYDGAVSFLKTSLNGKVLIAGFGLHGNQRPRSFAVWEVDKNEPVLRFNEPEGANADLSPDGQQIALSRFGRGDLELFKWRTGERVEIPLRNSPGTWAVYWSPDGKRLAAYVDTYPSSIIIYDTMTWKPIAHWDCGRIGHGSEFMFTKDGTLLQIRENEINALDVSYLKRIETTVP